MQLVVARIGRAHGVRGEVTIEVRTDKPEERFFVGGVLETEPANLGPLRIATIRNHNGTLLLSFEGKGDRGKAEDFAMYCLLPMLSCPAKSSTKIIFMQLRFWLFGISREWRTFRRSRRHTATSFARYFSREEHK